MGEPASRGGVFADINGTGIGWERTVFYGNCAFDEMVQRFLKARRAFWRTLYVPLERASDD